MNREKSLFLSRTCAKVIKPPQKEKGHEGRYWPASQELILHCAVQRSISFYPIPQHSQSDGSVQERHLQAIAFSWKWIQMKVHRSQRQKDADNMECQERREILRRAGASWQQTGVAEDAKKEAHPVFCNPPQHTPVPLSTCGVQSLITLLGLSVDIYLPRYQHDSHTCLPPPPL